jgi:hypothetical protein
VNQNIEDMTEDILDVVWGESIAEGVAALAKAAVQFCHENDVDRSGCAAVFAATLLAPLSEVEREGTLDGIRISLKNLRLEGDVIVTKDAGEPS